MNFNYLSFIFIIKIKQAYNLYFLLISALLYNIN